jgi:hypothetical protein
MAELEVGSIVKHAAGVQFTGRVEMLSRNDRIATVRRDDNGTTIDVSTDFLVVIEDRERTNPPKIEREFDPDCDYPDGPCTCGESKS